VRARRAGKPTGRLRLLIAGCGVLALAALPTSALGQAAAAAPGSGARMTYIAAPARTGAASEVMLAKTDGSAPLELGPANTAVLSPDGNFVEAVRTRSGAAAHGSVLALYWLSRKSPSTRVLRTSGSELTILAWSPDDKWIAVIDGDSLIAVPLHGAPREIATGTIDGASFAPSPPDRLVFAKADSVLAGATVNLYKVALVGGAADPITSDGLDEYPLWGPSRIVYSHELSHSSPTLQLWSVLPSGRNAKQLTDLPPIAPFYGLEPVALSANGEHLLANLVGDNATEAWSVDLTTTPAVARDVGTPGSTTLGNAISRDGNSILLTEGSSSLAGDSVAAIPWAGGVAATLAMHGAFASWDR
jgi:hypothetical protein